MQSTYNNTVSESRTATSRRRPSTPIQSAAKPSIAANVKGKDLFDSIIWNDPTSTSVFYTFIASLRQKIRAEVKATTPTHRFIRTLRDSQRLMRCYTQNIDGLEAREGLCNELERGKGSRTRFSKKSMALPKAPTRTLQGGDQDGGCEVVPLHGDLDVLRCTLCQKTCGWEGGREALLLNGKAPECMSCTLQDQGRRNRGKRGSKIGTLRPNIILYGEEHPAADAISAITTNDLSFGPDVLLILGTSLHVHGLKVLVKEFAKAVHARAGGKRKVIYVSLTKPSESVWRDVIDYWVAMDCDQWVAGMKRHRPDIWQIQTELKPQVTKVVSSSGSLTTVKNTMQSTEGKENLIPKIMPPEPAKKLSTPASKVNKSPLRVIDSSHHRGAKTNLIPNEIYKQSMKRKRAIEKNQLPTPPPSGHRNRYQDMFGSECRTLESVSTTPSKRRKPEIIIYQD